MRYSMIVMTSVAIVAETGRIPGCQQLLHGLLEGLGGLDIEAIQQQCSRDIWNRQLVLVTFPSAALSRYSTPTQGSRV